jgi:hypothetical protein
MHYDDSHDNDNDDTLYGVSLPYLMLSVLTDGKLEFNVLSQNIIFITSCLPITYASCTQLRSKPRMCYKSSVRLSVYTKYGSVNKSSSTMNHLATDRSPLVNECNFRNHFGVIFPQF